MGIKKYELDIQTKMLYRTCTSQCFETVCAECLVNPRTISCNCIQIKSVSYSPMGSLSAKSNELSSRANIQWHNQLFSSHVKDRIYSATQRPYGWTRANKIHLCSKVCGWANSHSTAPRHISISFGCPFKKCNKSNMTSSRQGCILESDLQNTNVESTHTGYSVIHQLLV